MFTVQRSSTGGGSISVKAALGGALFPGFFFSGIAFIWMNTVCLAGSGGRRETARSSFASVIGHSAAGSGTLSIKV